MDEQLEGVTVYLAPYSSVGGGGGVPSSMLFCPYLITSVFSVSIYMITDHCTHYDVLYSVHTLTLHTTQKCVLFITHEPPPPPPHYHPHFNCYLQPYNIGHCCFLNND